MSVALLQGGRVGSHKVAGKGYIFTKTSQMASIGVIFTSTYHTKQLNPWPNSSASRVVNYSQLSACQGDMQPFEGGPYTRGCLTSLRNKPQRKQPGQLSASIPGWIVSQRVQLSFDGEKCVLLLCAWKPACLRSGHIQTFTRASLRWAKIVELHHHYSNCHAQRWMWP